MTISQCYTIFEVGRHPSMSCVSAMQLSLLWCIHLYWFPFLLGVSVRCLCIPAGMCFFWIIRTSLLQWISRESNAPLVRSSVVQTTIVLSGCRFCVVVKWGLEALCYTRNSRIPSRVELSRFVLVRLCSLSLAISLVVQLSEQLSEPVRQEKICLVCSLLNQTERRKDVRKMLWRFLCQSILSVLPAKKNLLLTRLRPIALALSFGLWTNTQPV